MSFDEDPKIKPDTDLEKDKEEKFSFLRETIKTDPPKNRPFTLLFRAGIIGLIFGSFTCFGFYALKPTMQQSVSSSQITFPEDEPADEGEIVAEDEDDTEPDNDDTAMILENVYGIVKEADRSIVSIQTAPALGEIPEPVYSSAAGLIVADNGQELLILTTNSICSKAAAWKVRLAEDKEYDAVLKKQDKNTGIAVFAVPKSKIEVEVWNAIKIAHLGNSNLAVAGDLVFTIGDSAGYKGGVGYGIISSNGSADLSADRHYSILSTDMFADGPEYGFIFNLSGEVIALMDPELKAEGMTEETRAYAISGLKQIIELLVNGKGVPYTGICGTTVNETVSTQEELPTGVYVTQVQADSPAMASGIQCGDILEEMDGVSLVNVSSFENMLLEKDVGDIVSVRGKRRGASGYVDIDFSIMIESRE